MFNEYQSIKDAQQRREQYMQEAETYRMLKRLGHGGNTSALSIVALVIIVVVLAFVLF